MTIQALAEQLINEVNNELKKLDELETVRKSNEEAEKRLRINREQLSRDKDRFETEKEGIEKEKEYIKIALQKTANQETVEAKLDEKREENKVKEIDLINQREKIEAESKLLDEKIKQYDFLVQKERDLEKREALSTKTEQLLDKRKREMDEDIQFINNEKVRLQNIASRHM